MSPAVPLFTESFSGRAHGKVNLHLGVGEARADGYHELSTVFMAVDRPETVTLTPAEEASISTTFHVEEPDEDVDTPRNLAWRAVEALAGVAGDAEGADLPPVRIEVDKTIPVAGGMAGGSADAAAAVVAAEALLLHYGYTVEPEDRDNVLKALGADVPFAAMGGVALGTDRGDSLVPMMCRGSYWFAFLNPQVGLSTGKVFEKLDDLRFTYASMVPHTDTALISRALLSGDPHQVGAAMHNDLEPAALALRPSLQQIIHDAEDAGAIRAMVSGSGPTIAALCEDQAVALRVVDKLTAHGNIEGFAAQGPVGGAALL
ncbi:4-(cytidine 5'-diphospho)-2-C-methyl-D-erythritol kinase [Corynebacterium sp. CCUG 69979]|uniref:4-(cytidine 5'-diphospho)-2-C-methyl-D-erythritol kinase n=1 Tax=Corynebacterium sp. CCUG 69979 TaxID=2823890 RepID=UPI002109CFCD|nr:4-(cytidine 5'-diphospho)-2-C-methyl-D-erythritol kinase [Corynebacterium sp. CCUG 69979]MCQ4625342.1 4-(cytidine 5'-diphospho)-2-C-methyl-D-erythritol kinase [Corynebacterium sp. CCUG 69979]